MSVQWRACKSLSRAADQKMALEGPSDGKVLGDRFSISERVQNADKADKIGSPQEP
jgi:hypothetical protein